VEPRYRLTIFEALSIIILLAAAAAAQQAVQPPTEEEQEGAIGCMRTIVTAEEAYAGTYNQGYSPSLGALAEVEGKAPSASAAGLIDTSLGSGKRKGYIYTYRPGPKDAQGQIRTYTVTARPMKWQKGVLSVFTDQTGVIRVTKENRAANGKDPALK
jgi:hypothetical protein